MGRTHLEVLKRVFGIKKELPKIGILFLGTQTHTEAPQGYVGICKMLLFTVDKTDLLIQKRKCSSTKEVSEKKKSGKRRKFPKFFDFFCDDFRRYISMMHK